MTATASGRKLTIVCIVPRKKKLEGLSLPETSLVINDTTGKY